MIRNHFLDRNKCAFNKKKKLFILTHSLSYLFLRIVFKKVEQQKHLKLCSRSRKLTALTGHALVEGVEEREIGVKVDVEAHAETVENTRRCGGVLWHAVKARIKDPARAVVGIERPHKGRVQLAVHVVERATVHEIAQRMRQLFFHGVCEVVALHQVHRFRSDLT